MDVYFTVSPGTTVRFRDTRLDVLRAALAHLGVLTAVSVTEGAALFECGPVSFVVREGVPLNPDLPTLRQDLRALMAGVGRQDDIDAAIDAGLSALATPPQIRTYEART